MPDLSTIGTVGGALLVAISGLIGILFKRASDRQAARDAVAKDRADRESADRKAASELEARKAQETYDQMQEDLSSTRAEVRALQDDLNRARTELSAMWAQFTTLRMKFEAAESHIADLHRWADGGATGPRPQRPREL